MDNPPVIINSLDRIDRITFRIIEESTQVNWQTGPSQAPRRTN
jgi:hypothetical protein